jgi:hypothetical protein
VTILSASTAIVGVGAGINALTAACAPCLFGWAKAPASCKLDKFRWATRPGPSAASFKKEALARSALPGAIIPATSAVVGVGGGIHARPPTESPPRWAHAGVTACADASPNLSIYGRNQLMVTPRPARTSSSEVKCGPQQASISGGISTSTSDVHIGWRWSLN